MQVHNGYHQLPSFKQPVVTIGSFDGIHLGHRKIIQQVVAEAELHQSESILITFEPHPRSVLFPHEAPVQLLQTLEEKIPILEQLGLHHLIVVPFTLEFAALSAQEYIADFLVHYFHPKTLIIGYDHHFGRNRDGNLHTLLQAQASYLFNIKEISAEEINQIAISSSKVRTALLQGDIATANHYLFEPFRLSGKVVKGQQLGRQLGYPTANLEISHPHKLIPADGVYAVEVLYHHNTYKGMLGIGRRPTLSDHLTQTIEVHLFDFNEMIYNETITLVFKHWLRADQKFDSLDSLKEALALDEMEARKKLAS